MRNVAGQHDHVNRSGNAIVEILGPLYSSLSVLKCGQSLTKTTEKKLEE